MPKTTKEWDMIQELFEMVDDLETTAQQEFITNLHEHIDPHAPFFEQLIGLPESQEKQNDWLYVLHDYYCNGNEDAFDELDD